MSKMDLTAPDRHIGSMLSGEEVENLRAAIIWLREHRGFRVKDIAVKCEIPEHTARNFASRKSIRPDGVVLGKLYKYFVGNRELLPEGFFASDHASASEPPNGFLGKIARFDIIKMELPISESDLRRVYDRYSGYYLCFRRSDRLQNIMASWLHLVHLNPKTDLSHGGLPLPRFTLLTEYPDRFDPGTKRSFVTLGYGFSRSGRIYLIGQHDGNLQNFILNEPSAPKFTYMQGLLLATSAEHNESFAARVVCQYLGGNVDRHKWSDRIGIFSQEKFNKLFENASIIMRAIGDNDLLVARSSEN